MLSSAAELLRNLVNPPDPIDPSGYFTALLSTAGVLFGLTFAALLFVLESGFASFRFSRRMFLEVYVHFGRSLLIPLAYLTVLPFGMLYLPFSAVWFSIGYYFFAVTYAKSIFDHARHVGYIHTLVSSAFVPSSFGPLRSYFRYVTNLGCLPVTILLLLGAGLFIYPIAVSVSEHGSWTITPKGFFYSSLLVLFHTIIRVTNFVPEFFALSNQELDAKSGAPDADGEESSRVDFAVERQALRQFLISRGVDEVDPAKPASFLDGELSLALLMTNDGPEAWFNAWVNVNAATNIEIRDQVCKYLIGTLEALSESKVDINQFVLSFQIKIKGDSKTRNMFFRITRSEIGEVLSTTEDPVRAVSRIRNQLIDDLFRHL